MPIYRVKSSYNRMIRALSSYEGPQIPHTNPSNRKKLPATL